MWGEKTEKPKSKMDLEIFASKRSKSNTKYISIDFS